MSAVSELSILLRQAGDLELPTLSDDEVAALAPLLAPEARLVPLLTHAGLDTVARQERIVAGEQSLIERSLLLVEDDRVRESDELRTIRAVRDEPLAVTILDLVRGDRVASRYVYGLGSDAFVLVEQADGGSHSFRVAEPGSVAEALASEIDPDGLTIAADALDLAKTADGEPADWHLVEEAVSSAAATVRLYAVRRTAESRVEELESSLVVTADAVWLVAGEVDARTGEGKLIGRRLDRDGLVEVVRAFVA
jgi:hypothetical protein